MLNVAVISLSGVKPQTMLSVLGTIETVPFAVCMLMMRVALMCLKAGQKLEPHKAPLRLMMYCVQGKGTFTVGDEKMEADEKTCLLCDPSVSHGFEANKGVDLVVMAIVTPVD